MKRIKVFHNGERLKDVYPFATKWQVFKFKVRKFIRKVLQGILVTSILTLTFLLGQFYGNTVVYTIKADEKVMEAQTPPILERIAECESGNTHYRKDGQIVFNANTNGTVDIGKYQINTVWNAKATELGLDLTKEKDNEEMAKWIYANRGTGDWYSSQKCWRVN